MTPPDPSPDADGPVEAVLFDFAGTLAMPEDDLDWVRAVRPDLPREDAAALARRLVAAGRPGGPYPASVPPAVAADYAARDLDPATHRRAYEALLATEVDAGTARRLYERVLVAEGWTPYPDAVPVLAALRARGLRTVLVSNIGFPLAGVLAGTGLAPHLDGVVTSLEVGEVKPHPRVFARAAEIAGAPPARCLVVGDNPAADPGGVALGMRTLLLPMTPAGRTHGLGAVLQLVGTA